jgi:uncharacterized membrane protein
MKLTIALTRDESKRRHMWNSIVVDWASLTFRWLQVVAAMGWIGSSFCFIHLDLGLQSGKDVRGKVAVDCGELVGPLHVTRSDYAVPADARQ